MNLKQEFNFSINKNAYLLNIILKKKSKFFTQLQIFINLILKKIKQLNKQKEKKINYINFSSTSPIFQLSATTPS